VALVTRYLLDTSVWARRRHASVAKRTIPLVKAGLVATCSVLDAEALYSTRTPEEYERVRHDRRAAYELLSMDQEVWDRALGVQRELAARSLTRAVGLSHLLISATAELHEVTVVHYDADFDQIVAVTGQSMEWIVPDGSLAT
jgi:predicted nucleic acid-binding protein